jgi:hypothetical protein
MFALIMKTTIILGTPSISARNVKRSVWNIYMHGNMCCC